MIYLKSILRPDISEKQELNASRLAMVGAIAVAGYFGLNPPDFAAGTVAIAFGQPPVHLPRANDGNLLQENEPTRVPSPE